MTTMTLIAVGLVGVLLAAAPADAADVYEPSAADLDRVAGMVAPHPGGFGPAAADRAAWSKAAARPEMREVVKRAEGLVATPLPAMTDDLYLDYSRTGNRDRGQAVFFERRGRVSALAFAECLEARGRFLPALEETIRSIAAEKSWTMPAHDGNLQTFEGRLATVDLAAASFAWDLAAADNLLGDRLQPDTRALIRAELERRIFEPYRRMVAGKQPQYWLLYEHNWNSVCLAGVTGAALAIVDDPRARAWFVLAAEHYSRYSLKGFTPDGYCSEGVGYWNYGFGNYASLAELVRRATRGGVDLLARDEAVMPAAYGSRIEITGGVCPAFADCPVNAAPAPGLVDYLSRRFTGKGTRPHPETMSGTLGDRVMALFPEKASAVRSKVAWPSTDPLRTCFPDETVLICRPAAGGRMGVALQGGHNAQNHNHNDVGVFMVVVGRSAVLPDIGAEVYTARTFGAHRYDSQALNSWGHAVPVIAGKLQRAGRAAAARVLDRSFSEAQDRLVMDIRSAYDVPTLQTLERAFVFAREGGGSLTVTDTFAFSAPETFETALLTFGQWEQTGPTTLKVSDGDEAVRVDITVPADAELDVVAEPVKEDLTARRAATRIGLRLRRPLQQGAVTLRVTPESR